MLVGEIHTRTEVYNRYFIDLPLSNALHAEYEEELDRRGPSGRSKYVELETADDATTAWVAWIEQKIALSKNPREQERLKLYALLIGRYGSDADMGDAIKAANGHAFRRLELFAQVPAWTDDYSDVLRVMMIPELQAVRKFFGLPTPIER
jgi:hypothetical protein